MSVAIIQNRIKNVRRQLKRKKLDAFLLVHPANVSYVTGFSGHESWAMITKNQFYLLTDSRYFEQAQKECPLCTIVQRTETMSRCICKLLNKLKSVKLLAVEDSISVAGLKSLKKEIKIKMKSISKIIEPFRKIKDKGEVAAIFSAANIASKALEKTRSKIKAGISESHLAGMLDLEIRKLGGTTSFETIAAFGANASEPHYQPANRRLKKNDTMLIDFGAKYKGYCCDITRCFTVGKATKLYKKAYETVRRAQEAAIGMVKDGVEISKVDEAARKVAEEAGFPVYGHGTGHGLGLEVHEGPVLTKKIKGKLEAGMVVTIEPGIYIPGKLGIRIEDNVLVTEKGFKILTKNCPY